MMELSQIQQYSHKIIKIKITNKNEKSSYDYATIKVHLDRETNETIRFSLTKSPTATEWIEHQSFDSDYFLRIPNITPSVTEIYAHFFPSDLYDYTEAEEIFSIYDFSDFIKDSPKNQWDGMEYPLQINSYGYEMLIGYDNKPLIRSLLNSSVTRYKDPNYKNYIKTYDNFKNISDMTEKGRFPLSSRYRNSLYRTAPNLNDNETFRLPYWKPDTIMYSHGASPVVTSNTENTTEEGFIYEDETATDLYVERYGSNDCCNQRNVQIPYWEAKIHRSGISPLIGDTEEDEDEQFPINVYLNYQYLPTSTEYHQHYFGFESHNIKTKNGGNKARNGSGGLISAVETYIPDKNNTIKYNTQITEQLRNELHDYCEKIKDGTYRQITTNRTFEALDGEGLSDINQNFIARTIWVCDNCDYTHKESENPPTICPNCKESNSFILKKDRTYRLIRHGNPFDSSSSFYKTHRNIYDINLDKITITDNCLWEKNGCPNETNSLPYWTYTPEGEGAAFLNITLKAHTPYVLKYFIYIPADAYVEDDSCYVEVQSHVADNVEVIGELHQAFKNKDKDLRHQWIYHEIPFYTLEQNNRIVIKGPQHSHEGIIGINRLTNEVITQITDEVRNNPDIELHDCKNDLIHFYSMQVAEMVEYSPTMKYTQNGLYLVEGNRYTKKSLKYATNTSSNNSCACETNDSSLEANNEWADKDIMELSGTWINRGTTQLPTPLTDIYIFFDDDFSIIYNQLSTELSYTKGDYPFKFDDFNESFDEILTWVTDDEEISLKYDRQTIVEEGAAEDQSVYYGPDLSYVIEQRPDNDDLKLDKLFLAELKVWNRQYKFFTSGINNNFTLRLQDAYSQPITTGQVECSIWTNNHEDTTPCNEAEKCLGIQEPDEYGTIEYKNLNFKNLKPQRYKYYLRIRYINNCYNKEIIKWKELLFIDEHRNIEIRANNCDKKVCTHNYICNNCGKKFNTLTNSKCPQCNSMDINKCCSLVATSYFDNTELKYEKSSNIYTITSVESLPLRLDVAIRSQSVNGNDGNIINEGYCELSVNDKVIQTTFVDDNGIADFYLDENDLDPGQQVIKVEYFTHPYESINFAYFPILCDTEHGYDERPAIPILINKLTNDTAEQLTTQMYEISKDDIFFVDIDTENCKDFSITIIRNNIIQENINVNEIMNRSYIITAMHGSGNNKNPNNRSFLDTHLKNSNNQDIDKYTIITGNIKDENGKDITNKYRSTKKEFTLIWKDI